MTKVSKSLQTAKDSEPGVAAVNRALSILEAFSPSQPTLTLAQLSRETGLYKSTILRLIESLEAFGYLKRCSEGGYALGAAPLRLAAVYQNALQPSELIIPVLRELVDLTLESASYYVKADDQRLCAYRVHSPRSIRDHVQAGQLLPLDKGAAAVVLMAFSGAQGERFEQTRQRLYAVSRGERDSETAAISAPVLGVAGKLEGALCISGPCSRFTDEAVEAMKLPLLSKAAELSAALGGNSDEFLQKI